jgi:predicted transposase/invertase (TIGR01784 family)
VIVSQLKLVALIFTEDIIMMEVASLHYGVIFKKAFSQPHIFAAIINDFFGVEIEIDSVETKKSFSPVIGYVDSRFDLFAEDKKNRIIVDIQHKRLPDHYDRFLHYHCTTLLEQVTSTYDYTPKRQVLTLVVLTSGDRHKTDISITDFEPKTLAGKGVGETPHKIIYIAPKYVNEQTPEPYQQWLKAINDSLDGQVEESHYPSSIIQDIFTLIKKDKTTPQEYARMKDEYANEQYIKEKNEQAREQGLEEGLKEGKRQLAKNLLDVLDIETIALKSGLSIEEVQQLHHNRQK